MRTKPTMTRRFARDLAWLWAAGLIVLTVLSALGCGQDFDPPSKLNTLRVLAIKANNPYPKPGETVQLDMLWVDAKSPLDQPRPVQILWLAGCFNPEGDLYYQCGKQLGPLLQKGMTDPEVQKLLGAGDHFQVQIPSNIISSRPTTEGVDPYGLSYVFFVACAGTIGPTEPGPDGLPLGCFDASGKKLGADDYVAGYFSMYSYNDRTNANPIVRNMVIDNQAVPEGQEAHFPRCQGSGSCNKISFKADVDPSSVEINAAYQGPDGQPLQEQMWVNYYATGGDVESAARLVNDATKGFNADHGTDLELPRDPGKVRLYGVVHDNRGGVAWVVRDIVID